MRGLSRIKAYACKDAGKRNVCPLAREISRQTADINKSALNEFLSGCPSKIPIGPFELRSSHRRSDLRAAISDLLSNAE